MNIESSESLQLSDGTILSGNIPVIVNESTSEITAFDSTSSEPDKVVKKQTVHNNAEWLNYLTSNFEELVISKCSERVRTAVGGNELIQVR